MFEKLISNVFDDEHNYLRNVLVRFAELFFILLKFEQICESVEQRKKCDQGKVDIVINNIMNYQKFIDQIWNWLKIMLKYFSFQFLVLEMDATEPECCNQPCSWLPCHQCCQWSIYNLIFDVQALFVIKDYVFLTTSCRIFYILGLRRLKVFNKILSFASLVDVKNNGNAKKRNQNALHSSNISCQSLKRVSKFSTH